MYKDVISFSKGLITQVDRLSGVVQVQIKITVCICTLLLCDSNGQIVEHSDMSVTSGKM